MTPKKFTENGNITKSYNLFLQLLNATEDFVEGYGERLCAKQFAFCCIPNSKGVSISGRTIDDIEYFIYKYHENQVAAYENGSIGSGYLNFCADVVEIMINTVENHRKVI